MRIEKPSIIQSERTLDYDILLDKCLKGDIRAQQKLFDVFNSVLFLICLRYMKNYEIAQDLMQEGFVKIFNKLSDFNGDGSLEGWMKKIMANTCLDQLRKDQKLKLNLSIENIGNIFKDDQWIEENLMARDLLKVAESLPERYRRVFFMTVIEGYSHKEIADKLNIVEGTSRCLLSKAKTLLRKEIMELDVQY